MDEGKILKRYAGISEAQHFLYFFPLPQGQGALRDIFSVDLMNGFGF